MRRDVDSGVADVKRTRCRHVGLRDVNGAQGHRRARNRYVRPVRVDVVTLNRHLSDIHAAHVERIGREKDFGVVNVHIASCVQPILTDKGAADGDRRARHGHFSIVSVDGPKGAHLVLVDVNRPECNVGARHIHRRVVRLDGARGHAILVDTSESNADVAPPILDHDACVGDVDRAARTHVGLGDKRFTEPF